MTTDPDDDALRWDGDEPDAPAAPAEKAPSPAPAASTSSETGSGTVRTGPGGAVTAAGAGSAAVGTGATAEAPGEDEEPAVIGNAALVFYGIIGGVYLLFAVGWIVGGLRLRPRASLLLVDWMYFPWMWLAALAPVLWFATTWVLTRGRATWIRVVALIAGAALLVPWPFVMFGTVGA